MSFKRMIRRTCACVARNITRGPVRSSAPAPVPAPAPVQAFTPNRTRWAPTCAQGPTRSSASVPAPAPAPLQAFTPIPAPLPAVDEWAAALSSMLAETLDAADALAPADSAPATSSDATPAPAVKHISAPAPAPALAVTDAENTVEVAAAQPVLDKAPTTGNLHQRVHQYAVARKLAAGRSKSDGPVLRCIQLEDELATEHTRADMAEAASSASRNPSNRSSMCTVVGDCDEIARLHKEPAVAAAAATTAANQCANADPAARALKLANARADHAERALKLANARADRAEYALELAADRANRAEAALAEMTARADANAAKAADVADALEAATARVQELEGAHAATSASNMSVEQVISQKEMVLTATFNALMSANQKLRDAQNELAIERDIASERAKDNVYSTVDVRQQTDNTSYGQINIDDLFKPDDQWLKELDDIFAKL
ncbi:hypothetical protein H4R19_003948 [Coemansia spiralis]|nr:hypothetical protein H4R19_003948 [Coemansia spiralis]